MNTSSVKPKEQNAARAEAANVNGHCNLTSILR